MEKETEGRPPSPPAMTKPLGLRKKEEAFRRLEERRRYGEHRVALLREVPDFMAKWKALQKWLGDFVESRAASGIGEDSIAIEAARTLQVARFEDKWRVRVQIFVSSKGKLDEPLIVDNHYPQHPEFLTPDCLERIRRAVQKDPERYVVVDRHISDEEVDDCLKYLLPAGKRGKKQYKFKLEPEQVDEAEQVDEDCQIVRFQHGDQKDNFEELTARFYPYPHLARQVGYKAGSGINPEHDDEKRQDQSRADDEEKLLNEKQEKWEKEVRQVKLRWSRLKPLVSPVNLPDEGSTKPGRKKYDLPNVVSRTLEKK